MSYPADLICAIFDCINETRNSLWATDEMFIRMDRVLKNQRYGTWRVLNRSVRTYMVGPWDTTTDRLALSISLQGTDQRPLTMP